MHCKNAMIIIYLVFLSLIFSIVTSHTMTDAKKLLADKMQNYEKIFRPLVNQSAPVVLYVGMELLSIQEFNEVQEKLTITAVTELYWVDEYMKWKPSNYGHLEELVIDSDKVWTPNLVLTNNVEKLEKIGDSWQLIRFISNGTAWYYPGNVLSASCRVDVTYYPFDRHRCVFSFSAWAHSPSEIIFKPSTDKVKITYFTENGAWTLYNSSVTNYDYFLDFFVYLERKPRFVLLNVIVPIIFMAFLNTIIFAIPIESGERISYSITVLLAIAVFLTLVGDNLPKTSSPMSFFSYYLLVVLVISICITLATIFNVRLYYRDDDDPVHRGLARFVSCFKCNCRNKRYQSNPIYPKITHGKSLHMDGKMGKYVRSKGASVLSKKNIHLPMSNQGKFLSDQNSTDDTVESEKYSEGLRQEILLTDANVSWKDVSATFDTIFFVLFFLIVTIATVVFFLYIFVSQRSWNKT